MTQWVDVAELADVSRRKRKRITVDGHDVALFYVQGEVFAFQDTCVHQARSLAKGSVLHGRVICPGHQWAFDLRTGQVEDGPECQPTYAVKVEHGRIWIDPTPRAHGRAVATTIPAAPPAKERLA